MSQDNISSESKFNHAHCGWFISLQVLTKSTENLHEHPRTTLPIIYSSSPDKWRTSSKKLYDVHVQEYIVWSSRRQDVQRVRINHIKTNLSRNLTPTRTKRPSIYRYSNVKTHRVVETNFICCRDYLRSPSSSRFTDGSWSILFTQKCIWEIPKKIVFQRIRFLWNP
jgi:hypothetical protein